MIYKAIKRVFDFVCAFLGIVGTSPIWILSIVLTELSDPVLLCQQGGEGQQEVQDVEVSLYACGKGRE